MICAVLFHAYGFRMMGQWPPLAGLLAAAAIFVAQLVLSRWWMARFCLWPAGMGAARHHHRRLAGMAEGQIRLNDTGPDHRPGPVLLS